MNKFLSRAKSWRSIVGLCVAAFTILAMCLIAQQRPASAFESGNGTTQVGYLDPSGDPTDGINTFYAYVEAGETLSLSGFVDPDFNLSQAMFVCTDPSNAATCTHPADDGTHYWDISVFDTTAGATSGSYAVGTQVAATSKAAGNGVNVGAPNSPSTPLTFTPTTSGVYAFRIGPRAGWSNLYASAGGALVTGSDIRNIIINLNWKFQVLNGTTEQTGRIWTNYLGLDQTDTDGTFTDSLYTLSESGYMYKVDLNDYMGFTSTLRFSAQGLVDNASGNSINESVSRCGEATALCDGTTNPAGNMEGKSFSTAGQYKIFFEEPSDDLPAAIKPAPIDDAGQQVGKITGIIADPTLTAPRAGDITYWLASGFASAYQILIDTNGNGSYTDPVDITIDKNANGGTANGSAAAPLSYAWDGLDNEGNTVPLTTTVTAKINIPSASSIYVSMMDVEQLGGLSLTQLNGSGAGNTTVYWNDDTLLNSAGQMTGEQNDGIQFAPPLGTWNGSSNELTGIDSTGGVHSWGGDIGGTLGDNRWIQTWMKSGISSDALDATESSLPAIAPAIHGDPTGPMTAQDVVDMTHAVVIDPNTGQPYDLANYIDQDQLDAINSAVDAGKVGPYPISFTTPDGTTVTTTITLTNNGTSTTSDPGKTDPDQTAVDYGNSPLVGSNDATYPDPSGPLTEDQVKAMTGVIATGSDGSLVPLSDITLDPADLTALNDAITAGKVGPQEVTYTYTDPVSGDVVTSTSVITLTNQGSGTPTTYGPGTTPDTQTTPNLDGTDIIGGNDFYHGDDQGDLDPIAAINEGGIQAKDKNGNVIPPEDLTVDPDQLDVINGHIDAGDNGTYPLTYTTPDGNEITVNVTLGDHGDPFTPDDPSTPADERTESIIGNDFTHDDKDGDITPTDALDLGSALAKDKYGNPIDLSDSNVDSDQLDAINKAIDSNQTGDFPLTFTTPDGTETTITVTLVSSTIAGKDFIHGDDQGPLTSDDVISNGHVTAKNADGTPMDPSTLTVDPDDLADINEQIAAGKTGKFPVTVTNPDGVTSTIEVTLTNSGNQGSSYVPDDPATPENEASETIGGDDFYRGDDQGPLTPEDALAYGHAVATDENGDPLPLDGSAVDQDQLDVINQAIKDGKVGDYPLTFTTPDGTEAIITVTLGNHGAGTADDPNTPEDESTDQIIANDFTHNDADGPISDQDAIKLGDARAKDKNGNPVPADQIKVDQDQLAAINEAIAAGKGGTFPLTYIAPDGTKTTITVTLVPVLAETGTDVTFVAIIGAALLLIGGSLILSRRRA